MTRKVLVQNDAGEMIPDRTWHEMVKMLYQGLIEFLLREKLVKKTAVVADDIESVVLRETDFTERGLAFWNTGVVTKWLNSFDRNPNKPLHDHRQLETALAKVAK